VGSKEVVRGELKQSFLNKGAGHRKKPK